MCRFVAFLRGINVGGHVVIKETLTEAFHSLGFQNVVTFKQSGNIIFETPDTEVTSLKFKIQTHLKAILGYDVAVSLRTLDYLKAIVESEPFRDQNALDTCFLITFLTVPMKFPYDLPMTIPKSTAQVIGGNGAELFSITHGGGEGALPNPFIEKVLGVKATTRNLNIIVTIVEKFC
jgi:uncharacterized protein (DUF1697 family)